MKNNLWNIALILLIPLGELKAIFYSSNLKVDWYLLSDHQRYICNVLEDYTTHITLIILFGYMKWANTNKSNAEIIRFLLIISILDIIHLGTYDKQGLIFIKFAIAILIWVLCRKEVLLKIKEKCQQY